MRSANDMNSSLVEYVNGIQVIKAFNRSASSYGKYSKSVNYFHDSTMEWWSQCWFWNAAARAVLPSTLLGTLPVGAWLYMEGTLSLPVFLISLVVPLGFVAPLMKVSEAMEQVSMIKGNLEQVTAFLKTPELVRPSEPVSLGERTYQFEDIHFGYKETEVLHGISFQTRPGTMTAIVGPSGSGKSTIAKLMAGFWDVTSGSVRFGGQDIRQIPFEQLMGEISYVAQDNFLFYKSIRENIRMGNPAATDEEVEDAAKAANCHDFIMQLEQGYDTLAGDAGDRLSGGERQRITIARAMLKPSSVVILDEATAYADPENEALIQQAISKLVAGKTLIVVGSVIGRFFFQWMYDRTMSGTGYDIFRDYRLEIGEKLKQAPMGYFSEQNLGTIQTILTTTIADLEGYSMLAIEQMTSGVAMAALMSIMMFFFNPIIAILSLIGLLLGLLVLRWVRSRAAQYAPIYQEAQENLVSKTMEYIRGISVLGCNLAQLRNIKYGKTRTAGNQNRLSSFARRQLVFAVLLDRKVVRIAGFQFIEHDIHGVLEGLIVLSGFRGIDHFEQSSKVFLVVGCLVPDVADESCVVELFRLDPEIFAGLIAVSLRIDDDRIDQLEDVLLAADVREWVVVHGFPEIDGVQRLDDIAALFEHLAALHQYRTLRVSHNIAAVHLHQVRLHEKACLT